MTYVFVTAPCIACKVPFLFHPNRVPAAVVNGIREPICQACVERANPQRIARGLKPIPILPGAYEPADESEIVWPEE